MDISNPELYRQLQSYKDRGASGLDAFAEAQKAEVMPLRTSLLTAGTIPSTSKGATSTTPVVESFEGEESLPPSPNPSERPSTGTCPTPRTYSSSEGLSYKLLWFPFLVMVLSILSFELALYALIRQFVALFEYIYVWRGTLGELRERLRLATNYEEWKEAGLALDTHMKKDGWRKQPKMAYYDHNLITTLLNKTRTSRKQGHTSKLTDVLLQGGLKSNVGNIDCIRLYSNTYFGTKQVVEDFLSEVDKSLDHIGNSPDLTTSEKRKFFREAFRNYGRTALCLSGGATLAYFHFGVIRVLLDNDKLPNIITGTSAGSMIAAMVACRTDEELKTLLVPDMYLLIDACEDPFKALSNFISTGAVFNSREFASKVQWVTKGHTTFLEAYRETGKILNITAVPHESYGPAKLFNYLSTPNVVIWSAVLASSSIPGVLDPITIMSKNKDGILEPYLGIGVKWRDGSLKTDIPIEALRSQFNVTYTIVSQVNPHVAVFYYEHRGSVGRPAAHRHGKGWRGGFLASSLEHFIKLDLKKWLRVLRDLELLPFIMKQDWSNLWLQKFDGNVTILPILRLKDYAYIVTDPDLKRMEDYFKNGSHRTWPKLHMISNRMKIEKSILRWLRQLYSNDKDLLSSSKEHSWSDLPPEAKLLPVNETYISNFHDNSLLDSNSSSSQDPGSDMTRKYSKGFLNRMFDSDLSPDEYQDEY